MGQLGVIWPLAVALGFMASPPAGGPGQRIAYRLAIDSAAPSTVEVTIALENVPASFHLAMKVHPEYDARYWRFLDSLRIEDAPGATVSREDSTLWRVQLPAGRGTIRYRIIIQAPPSNLTGLRRVWTPFARADGAMINPPDFFLYVPELADEPVSVTLEVPASWQVATALTQARDPRQRTAANARTLLDSPILLGHLRSWLFQASGTTFHVAYWPEPGPGTFDDSAWIDGIHLIANQALAVFGTVPAKDYWFLLEDGAGDALEHAQSLTLGVQHEHLQQNPQAATTELTHEFFHTWNLVAVRPAGYNDLSYRPPARTPSLWIGEGMTMYYANLLPLRAGVVGNPETRDAHLARILQSYYSLPTLQAVSPMRASLAFGDSRATNPDATGGYYLQGELLAFELDAVIRDSTRDARSLDDVMRAMYAASQRPGYNGYAPDDFERAADSVCACRLDRMFDRQVRSADIIDVAPVLRRIGYRMIVDTLPPDPSVAAQPTPRLNVRVRFVDAQNLSPRAAEQRLAWLRGQR